MNFGKALELALSILSAIQLVGCCMPTAVCGTHSSGATSGKGDAIHTIGSAALGAIHTKEIAREYTVDRMC